MTYRTRKLLSAVVLVVGLPLYIVAATTLVGLIERPHLLIELAIYLALGIVWALPFRRLFLGIGREDPARQPRGGAAHGGAGPERPGAGQSPGQRSD